MKFHSMVLSETDYAVPTPDARVRAVEHGSVLSSHGDQLSGGELQVFISRRVCIVQHW